jgi:hypothetical protein
MLQRRDAIVLLKLTRAHYANENKISHRWQERAFASNFYFLISRFYFSCGQRLAAAFG